MTEKDFFKSQENFAKWKSSRFDISQCQYQIYDFEKGILIEKWRLRPMIGKPEFLTYIVELFKDGNGFIVYELTTIK